ncbi:hypothetical protein GJV06_07565 [Enterobacteriaceae bacterium RIT691]|nr:hypothetical protein [Enterobacteriaceae bacterium RIT691]
MAEIERTRRQSRSRSILTPQADYWEEDLPGRDEEQTYKPQLIRLNKKNDTWMEIPCYTNKSWWVAWVIFGILIPPVIVVLYGFFSVGMYKLLMGWVLSFSGLFVLFSFLAFFYREAVFSPRWTPIRFNLKRQKVYVYDFQQGWNPWARWPVVVKVFDWQDIYGERLFWPGRYTFGSQLVCAVCSPGNHQVLHRFPVTPVVGDIRMVWAEWSHICQYMQNRGVPTTPMFTDHPASWTPEGHQYRWPEDLDRESKTAP